MDIKEKIQEAKQFIRLLEYVPGQKIKCGKNTYWVNPCPVCNKKDHFTIYSSTNSYKSFSNCCKGGSIIDYMIEVEGLEKRDALNKVLEMSSFKPITNVIDDFKDETKKDEVQNKKELDKRDKPSSLNLTYLIDKLYQKNDDFSYFAKRLLNDYSYVVNKGFEENYDNLVSRNKVLTIKKGDLPKEILPNIFNVDNLIAIPVWENKKVVNMLLKKGDKKGNLKGFDVKPFNIDYLKTNCKQIFITEGIFDCLSLEMLGYKAISTNSTTNVNNFLDAVKENMSTCENTKFVIAFDNDNSGRKNATKLKEGLTELGIKSVNLDFPEEYKDINDIYLSDLEALKDSIDNIAKYKMSAAYLKTRFKENIIENKNRSRISTGIDKLDNILNGGLYPGLYTIGAISSLGKTALSLEIADNIAKSKQPVLFFSLEMPKDELFSRSISRKLALKNYDKFKNVGTMSILYGKTFVNNDFENIDISKDIEDSINDYANNEGENLKVIEGDFKYSIDNIVSEVEEFINITDKKPVVFIDYLQIIKPSKNDKFCTEKEKIDNIVVNLKRLSRNYKIPVIVISSFNRESYSSIVTFGSFKESGGIEYTSDFVIGLELAILKDLINEKNKEIKAIKIDEAKKQEHREVTLKLLKNRNGKTNTAIELDFYSKNNLFKISPINQHERDTNKTNKIFKENKLEYKEELKDLVVSILSDFKEMKEFVKTPTTKKLKKYALRKYLMKVDKFSLNLDLDLMCDMISNKLKNE